MTDRGPDSAGIAIYSRPKAGLGKLTIQSTDPEQDFTDLDGALHAALGQPVSIRSSRPMPCWRYRWTSWRLRARPFAPCARP